MKALWQLFPACFTPFECEELKAYALTHPPQDAVIGHGGTAQRSEMRRSTVRWLDRGDAHLQGAFARISARILEANRRAFGVDYQDFSEIQFTEYAATNAGHYDWHEDCTFAPDATATVWDRKLSVVIQLSPATAYQGGRLELDRHPLPQGKFVAQGDLIVFPSLLRHRVTPVTAGIRHSLVTWAVGPRWR